MPIIKDLEKARKKIIDISSRFDIANRKPEFSIVESIIDDVRKNGDVALRKYSEKFDKVKLQKIKIEKSQIKSATKKISKDLLSSIRNASQRIRKFQNTNLPTSWLKSFGKGEKLGYRYAPLDSVGVYIPGGKIPLISTVLMTVIPAQVAGVKRIAVFTPPPVHEGILAACELLGIDEIYQVGGAQAIAASCYGTKTIKPVNKIVGPGNIYVTLAKKIVFGKIGIDGLYGPSEIAIIADKTANPEYVASDLLSQLEHGSGYESAVLFTTSLELANKVELLVRKLAFNLPNSKIVLNSWSKNSAIILTKDLNQAVDLVNELAPEHLEIITKNPNQVGDKIFNAGAIFLGPYTCESLGDYVAGPSHCLPTAGSAKFSSGLTVMDFVKKISIISFDKKSLKKLSKDIVNLASAEKLPAHANAVRIRMHED